MTFIEPATQSFEDQTRGSQDTGFIQEKTMRRLPPQLKSQGRQPITSADLFALQRRFDRFINQLNTTRSRKI